ncbi:hypothetical protein MJJ08_18540 [Xanthomonas oryzae]|uniref:hypothetical protein n=1 Tax=Xanthomonas oryzae TaxID=347 RepID=UPI0023AF1D2F|nr:hypothetical protein [Xanthomonas oryzae]WEE97150.1 hypothetical protein MJJ08_18540 [Xanthomonas oryzae]
MTRGRVMDDGRALSVPAVMLVDEAKVAQRYGAALKAGEALSAREFDDVMQESGKLASLEVKVAVVQAILSSITYLWQTMKAEQTCGANVNGRRGDRIGGGIDRSDRHCAGEDPLGPDPPELAVPVPGGGDREPCGVVYRHRQADGRGGRGDWGGVGD